MVRNRKHYFEGNNFVCKVKNKTAVMGLNETDLFSFCPFCGEEVNLRESQKENTDSVPITEAFNSKDQCKGCKYNVKDENEHTSEICAFCIRRFRDFWEPEGKSIKKTRQKKVKFKAGTETHAAATPILEESSDDEGTFSNETVEKAQDTAPDTFENVAMDSQNISGKTPDEKKASVLVILPDSSEKQSETSSYREEDSHDEMKMHDIFTTHRDKEQDLEKDGHGQDEDDSEPSFTLPGDTLKQDGSEESGKFEKSEDKQGKLNSVDNKPDTEESDDDASIFDWVKNYFPLPSAKKNTVKDATEKDDSEQEYVVHEEAGKSENIETKKEENLRRTVINDWFDTSDDGGWI